MNDWREREALHRYGVIRELADERLTPSQRGALVRLAAQRLHPHPAGDLRCHGRSTIDRWIRAWRQGGFAALKPALREPGPLTDPALLAGAASLRLEVPERTGAQIAAILRAAHGEGTPSARTVQRHLAREGLRRPGRGESAGLVICGARFEVAETELRLERTLRAALEARGVPERLYVDNGAPFASGQLARICAHLGIRLIHSRPGRPEGRGKIERFFRTLRGQFLVEAVRREDLSLPDLNRMLDAWLERVYHRREHSETGQPPAKRFAAEAPLRRASAEELREAFLWSESRVVTRSATVSLHGNVYEVDPALRGRTVELRYDPYALGRVEVLHAGRSFGAALAHKVSRHVHPRAEADLRAEPPPRTGIDYLAIVETEHERSLARKISYREIDESAGREPAEGKRPETSAETEQPGR